MRYGLDDLDSDSEHSRSTRCSVTSTSSSSIQSSQQQEDSINNITTNNTNQFINDINNMTLTGPIVDDTIESSTGPGFASSLKATGSAMTPDERRRLRQERRQQQKVSGIVDSSNPSGKNLSTTPSSSKKEDSVDERFTKVLMKNEDQLLEFIAKINKVYEQKLKKDAPFMTFVLCGMQSSGKSTIMERFMQAVLNIVQEGTGTRCPLDTTCIHDPTADTPTCDLHGEELVAGGDKLSVDDVFKKIVSHNLKLANLDEFSTKPLRLVFRSKDVQNMRFVDTPGIISNKSTGQDNREGIKDIIRSELNKPNTKLCVLLEATEFAKNPVVDFLDESLGGRDEWIHNATFLMTKFDKQVHDSRTAPKANAFFKEFQDNGVVPHLVITPTLPKENLEPDTLYKARLELLSQSEKYENTSFLNWLDQHESFRRDHQDRDVLHQSIKTKLGFKSAKTVMRRIMLEDTARRLPEVLADLRKQLAVREKEEQRLTDMLKYNDPAELKSVVGLMLSEVDDRLHRYLDGDLESSLKFPEKLQTLDEEIEDEENSEWSTKELNHYSDREDYWRDRILDLDEMPEHVQPSNKFLGGKQYHRAVDFFDAVMVDALPDPFQLRELVPNLTGYLGGGLQRENWERATVEIVKTSLKDISHPGINFLVKHVGHIFRRLFHIAMDDIRHGEKFSATFKLLPRGVESYLNQHFDDVLWSLMENAASKTHLALEPMYSSINPNLPTFHPSLVKADLDDKDIQESWLTSLKNQAQAFLGTGQEAKRYLKEESRREAETKRAFLSDERTAMITKDESQIILQRSFEYIVGLLKFNLIILRFQLDHYLFTEFKSTMKRNFVYELMGNTDWDDLVQPDDDIAIHLKKVKDEIKSIKESLQEVQHMNRHF